MAKYELRLKARILRKNGHSIKRIAQQLRISKSTASIWCADIELSPAQIAKLRDNMIAGSYAGRLKGARMQKDRKQARLTDFRNQGIKEVSKLTARDLLMLGLGLYWGEGNKGGNTFQFVNSNPAIINAIIDWLKLFDVKREDFYCNVIINHIHKDRIEDIEQKWSHLTGIKQESFKTPVFIKSKNKKVYEKSSQYLGVLILRVYKSSELLYRVLGLIDGLGYKLN